MLLTGASGFIGSHCLSPLLRRGFDVHAVHVRRPGRTNHAVTWHRADLLDRQQVQSLLEKVRPQYLLHLAWYLEPGGQASAIENLEWVGASLWLVRKFQEVGGARCVIAGTCYEYDLRYGYCSEDLTPRRPETLYGASKNGLQEVFQNFCASRGVSGAWARPFFMYGPAENPRRLVSSIVRSLIGGTEARSSHGQQIRDYLHVQDVADAVVTLLDSQVQGAFNVASGVPTTISHIVEEIGEIMGRSDLLRIGALASHPNEAAMIVGDPAKFNRALAWSPTFTLRTGLEQTIAWWRTHLSHD